jgi:hypothetical protein
VANGTYLRGNGTHDVMSTIPASDLPAVLSSSITGTAANLADSVAGALPYQSATSVTSFLPIGSSGSLLSVSGALPVWESPVMATTPATVALATCSTARTVDWSAGNSFDLTLTNGNACTLSFTNQSSGQTITIWLHQPASPGSATVVWPTAKWFPAGAPVMTTGAAALDVCTCTYNGTASACNCLQNGG